MEIFLKDKTVHPCTGCSVCSMYGKPCPQKDDAAEIVEKMIAADVIVMATPVYFLYYVRTNEDNDRSLLRTVYGNKQQGIFILSLRQLKTVKR